MLPLLPGGSRFDGRIRARPDPEEHVLIVDDHRDITHRALTTTIQRVRDPQNGREFHDHLPLRRRQLREIRMSHVGRRLAVIPRHIGNDRNLIGGETTQSGVTDQVIRMLVVRLIRDVHARLVQKRRVLEQFPLAGLEHVQLRRLIEDPERQCRDVLGMREIDVGLSRERHRRGQCHNNKTLFHNDTLPAETADPKTAHPVALFRPDV